MAWLERHPGCKRAPDPEQCFGPWEDHYTFLGSDPALLWVHAAAAAALALLGVGALAALRRSGRLPWAWPRIAAAGGLAFVALFLALAALFPTRFVY